VGAWGNLWDAVKQLFTGDPEKYMVAASHGIGEGLIDAVVPLQGHNVDLGPAFCEMSPGPYWINLVPVTGPGTLSSVLELRFVPHSPAIVRPIIGMVMHQMLELSESCGQLQDEVRKLERKISDSTEFPVSRH
jgi:hypothetical protein